MTSRHQSAREETGENKKSLKIAMFDFQEYRQDRPQGLKKKKMNIQNLGLVAAQCNGIAAWDYFKNIYSTTLLYLTVHGL